MRLAFVILSLSLSLLSFSQEEINKNLPQIEFKTLEYNFGDIPYNSKAEYDFIFKNIGKGPLIIKKAQTS